MPHPDLSFFSTFLISQAINRRHMLHSHSLVLLSFSFVQNAIAIPQSPSGGMFRVITWPARHLFVLDETDIFTSHCLQVEEAIILS